MYQTNGVVLFLSFITKGGPAITIPVLGSRTGPSTFSPHIYQRLSGVTAPRGAVKRAGGRFCSWGETTTAVEGSPWWGAVRPTLTELREHRRADEGKCGSTAAGFRLQMRSSGAHILSLMSNKLVLSYLPVKGCIFRLKFRWKDYVWWSYWYGKH